MKKLIFYILGGLLLLISMGACTQDDVEDLDESGLPKISEVVISITSDTLNNVTFHIDNDGCIPMWIFPSDDPVQANDTIAQNDIVAQYVDAGTYTVQLKLYNRNGLSDGTLTETFTLESDYIVPFDDSEYLELLAGDASKSWVWDSTATAHLGCGTSGGDGTDWWSADAIAKTGCGMYDDVLTFSTGYEYTLNPGAGGTIFVNVGSGYEADYIVDENDYQVPYETTTTSFSLTREDEDVYLVLEANSILSYLPNANALTTPEYKIITLEENYLELVIDDGSIAWHYAFIPEGYDAGGDSGDDDSFDEGSTVDASDYATAIVGNWMWEYSTDGYFGCGTSGTEGTDWWSGEADGKEGYGLYDDILTFASDGSYTFDPGEGGTVYVNIDCAWNYDSRVDESVTAEDYQVAVDAQTTTYEITEKDGEYYLVFPENTLVSYVANADELSNPSYRITKFTENVIEFASDNGEIAWHYRFKKVD